MQNLPISNASPAAQAQAPASQDSGGSQAAEPFGSVLARQQSGSAAGNDAQAAAPAEGAADADDGLGAPAQISANAAVMGGGMLAAILSASGEDRSGVRVDGDDPDQHARGAGEAVDGGMLAALLPAMMLRRDSAAAGQQPGEEGAARSAAQAAAPLAYQGREAAAILGGSDKPVVNRSDVFSAALEVFGRESAPAPSHSAIETAAPEVTRGVSSTLPYAGVAPTAFSVGTALQLHLGSPVADNAWGEELGQKIIWMTSQREQIAELHLNPPHLGPLDVVLSVSGDQATVLFTSHHAEVRNAVEQALPKLREMLADNGIMLGNATVSDQPPGERQTGPDGRRQDGENWAATENGVATVGGMQTGLHTWPVRRHQGMVDTFA